MQKYKFSYIFTLSTIQVGCEAQAWLGLRIWCDGEQEAVYTRQLMCEAEVYSETAVEPVSWLTAKWKGQADYY